MQKYYRFMTALVIALLLCGGLAQAQPAAADSNFSEIMVYNQSSELNDVTVGPDGNLWFTLNDARKIGRYSTNGTIQLFSLPSLDSGYPRGITTGPDGALWFAEPFGNWMGRITTGGSITEYPLPTYVRPWKVITGPDNNLWFTYTGGGGESGIGKITTSGVTTFYPLEYGSNANGIVLGPDGNIWFGESDKIGKITPQGAITEYPVTPTCNVPALTVSATKKIWYVEDCINDDRIGQTDTTGTLSEVILPALPATSTHPTRYIQDIVEAPDGKLWFTELTQNAIGQIDTNFNIHEFPIPEANGGYGDIAGFMNMTLGPDGALWITESKGLRLGRYAIPGSITEFPLPQPGSQPSGITTSPGPIVVAIGHTGSSGGTIGTTQPGSGTVNQYPTSPPVSPGGIGMGTGCTFGVTDEIGNTVGTGLPPGCSPGPHRQVQATDTVTISLSVHSIPTTDSHPRGITWGPDDAYWFTEYTGNKIGRITTAGQLTEYPLPTANSHPQQITAGPDGAIWFTEETGKIGKIIPAGGTAGGHTPAGTLAEYSVPSGGKPMGITAGTDMALWFTEAEGNKIGRITLSGTISEHTIPTANSYPVGIIAAPDGSIWFTEYESGRIGRFLPLSPPVTTIYAPLSLRGTTGGW